MHDLGRVAVPVRIWQKPGPLTPGRLGAGPAARLPLRARPLPLAVPGRARARRHRPPRAARRLGLPPRNGRRGAHAAGAPARRRRRLPRDDRAAAAPRGALARAGRRDARPRRPAPAGWTPTPSPRCSRRPGSRAPRIERPAGLTEREAEVIGLLARGLQTKQVARGSGSRSRRPTTTSRTPTARSASRPARRRRCSRCSTGSRLGRTPDCRAPPAARSVRSEEACQTERKSPTGQPRSGPLDDDRAAPSRTSSRFLLDLDQHPTRSRRRVRRQYPRTAQRVPERRSGSYHTKGPADDHAIHRQSSPVRGSGSRATSDRFKPAGDFTIAPEGRTRTTLKGSGRSPTLPAPPKLLSPLPQPHRPARLGPADSRASRPRSRHLPLDTSDRTPSSRRPLLARRGSCLRLHGVGRPDGGYAT